MENPLERPQGAVLRVAPATLLVHGEELEAHVPALFGADLKRFETVSVGDARARAHVVRQIGVRGGRLEATLEKDARHVSSAAVFVLVVAGRHRADGNHREAVDGVRGGAVCAVATYGGAVLYKLNPFDP